jgi:hypothetical protein
MGSGKTEFCSNYERYQKGPNTNTSRNVFHCFIDTLKHTGDHACGGAPQLVGLYRKPGTAGGTHCDGKERDTWWDLMVREDGYEVVKMGEAPLPAGASSWKRWKKSYRGRRAHRALQTCRCRGHGTSEK